MTKHRFIIDGLTTMSLLKVIKQTTINSTPMRAAIYGAGSLGTILGAYITKNGGKVELINRNKAHIDALRKNGAKVTGTVNFSQPVTAYTPDEMSGTYDIIFLMTKQQQNKEVVTMLKEFLATDGVIVTLQNGIPELEIGDIVGENRVLGCTVAWGAPYSIRISVSASFGSVVTLYPIYVYTGSLSVIVPGL
jgi:ketopantoate reductase